MAVENPPITDYFLINGHVPLERLITKGHIFAEENTHHRSLRKLLVRGWRMLVAVSSNRLNPAENSASANAVKKMQIHPEDNSSQEVTQLGYAWLASHLLMLMY